MFWESGWKTLYLSKEIGLLRHFYVHSLLLLLLLFFFFSLLTY